MKTNSWIKDLLTAGLVAAVIVIIVSFASVNSNKKTTPMQIKEGITLPAPQTSGGMPVEEAISKRRSIREFSNKKLELNQISQMLWAAQGITGPEGEKRAAPSAGALYPMEVYVVTGSQVIGLEEGVYNYIPEGHKIKKEQAGDLRNELSSAALNQKWVEDAPLSIVITGIYERTTRKYTQHGERYVHIEAGHIGENLFLQAESLELGMVTVGAFQAKSVQKVLNLPKDHQPLYIIPLGYPE